jgi:hypothetical protein
MVEKDSPHVKLFLWARLASQAGAQDLVTRVVSSFEDKRCRESKNIRGRGQANRDYYNGLFNTQDGPTASISRLSK